MNRRLRLAFIFLLILSLMSNALTGLAASEAPAEAAASPSDVRVPVRAMLAANPGLLAGMELLPKGSGPIKSISSSSSVSPQRYNAFVIKVKVSPATQTAVDDLYFSYYPAKLTPQSVSLISQSNASILLGFTFVAAGEPGGTNVKFYSNTKKSVKDTTKVTIKPVPVSSVSLDTSSATLTVGGKLQLSATVLPANASNRSVKWSSSNKSIAAVSSSGLVTAKKAGKATITATTVSGGKKAVCKITVVKAAPTPTPTPKPTPTPTPANKTVYRALLIGNSDYLGTSSDLDGGPYTDVVMIGQALERSILNGQKYDGNISAYRDVTASGILSLIGSMRDKGIDSNDVTLFYYSGHGAQETATEDGTGIVGVDNYYIDVPTVKEALDTIPGTVIVILDSCFSGMFIGKNGVVVKAQTTVDPKGFNAAIGNAFRQSAAKGLTTSKYHVITACRKEETSLNIVAGTTSDGTRVYSGLATLFIAQGSGFDLYDQDNTSLKCDVNNNGIATIKEVFDYADANVDAFIDYVNDPDITQDMQYFTTNTSYPIVGRN